MKLRNTLHHIALGAGLSVLSVMSVATGVSLGLSGFYTRPAPVVRPYYELPLWRASLATVMPTAPS